MQDLFIDIETFSSVDLKSSGLYKYVASPDFEILLISYAFNNEPIKSIDLASGEEIPEELEEAFFDDTIIKHAHNATFERICLNKVGYYIPIENWRCTMIKAAYCGLPLGLEALSEVLDLENRKLATGKALIKYFSCPCKPTRLNGMRTRNYPFHNELKWKEYKEYNIGDTVAEREIHNLLLDYDIPHIEQRLYELDQAINDRGILIDRNFVINAINIDNWYSANLSKLVTERYGIDNPNSSAQLKQWLKEVTGDDVESLNKKEMPALMSAHNEDIDVSFVLKARQSLSKSSTKKYVAMLNCADNENIARGLFQFYGANRTGRWAGRLIQLQNLPQNHLDDIETVREYVLHNQGAVLDVLYDDVSSVLSQLIRTAFIAPIGKTFAVADFSAIEARVISWLANEEWRLEVFRTHGKIYEATASRMFSVPIQMVTKGSDMRQKGKVAELALGFGGSLNALKRMGGEAMGLHDAEMMSIVRKWREANPNIVDLWSDYEDCAKQAILYNKEMWSSDKRIKFAIKGEYLTIMLPSGRALYYYHPRVKPGKHGTPAISYAGIVQETKTWGEIDTYGGKLTENVVQAIARDLLADGMLRVDALNYPIVMHVHDELVAHVEGASDLSIICTELGKEVAWAPGLPMKADGYTTNFYKKD